MKKEKGIDDIFKHSLKEPVDETEFRESDWDAFENMLDKQKPVGRVFWLPLLGAAAAVILVFLGWLMFKPEVAIVQQGIQQMAGNKPAVNSNKPGTATPPAQQPQVAATTDPAKANGAIAKPTTTVKDEQKATPQNQLNRAYTANSLNKVKRGTNALSIPAGLNYPGNDKVIAQTNIDIVKPDNTITPVSLMPGITPVDYSGGQVLAANDMLIPIIRPLDASKVEVKKTTISSFHPLFAITALASSEINGVRSFQSASKGTNVGLILTASVKKISLSTGVNYSSKPYSLPFSDYPTTYTYKNAPETVVADCRVLDIPINIGYQLFNKSGNKITLGTGISSYIMMHESYTYEYPATTKKIYGPSYYAVEGKGKYLWSIMNLQATYERKINSSVGLSLQPYFKLPLSSIGYGQVKVQTFGVAVGLNWNINSLTKPK